MRVWQDLYSGSSHFASQKGDPLYGYISGFQDLSCTFTASSLSLSGATYKNVIILSWGGLNKLLPPFARAPGGSSSYGVVLVQGGHSSAHVHVLWGNSLLQHLFYISYLPRGGSMFFMFVRRTLISHVLRGGPVSIMLQGGSLALVLHKANLRTTSLVPLELSYPVEVLISSSR